MLIQSLSILVQHILEALSDEFLVGVFGQGYTYIILESICKYETYLLALSRKLYFGNSSCY
jgi:hypothetical protein